MPLTKKTTKGKIKETEKLNKNQLTKNSKCNKLVNKVVKLSMKQFDIGFYVGIHILKSIPQTKEVKERIKKMMKTKKEKKMKAKEDLIKKVHLDLCNPGCKGTFLESGKSLSPAFKKRLKNEKMSKFVINYYEKDRKEIFKKKTNVLNKNSFYEKVEPKNKKKLINKGAQSFCSKNPNIYKNALKK